MPIYMKYDSIEGDVTAAGHEKWIEVQSFQWGVGRGIQSRTGRGVNREASAPSISEVVVTKVQDKATIKLLDASLQGEGKTVTIDFVKTDGQKLEKYMTYILTNTMVSGYSISSGGDRPTESISLNFTKFQFKDINMDATNKGAGGAVVTYDIAAAKVV